MKKCGICGIKKPLSEFNKNKGRADGLQTICKDCNRVKSKAYYRDNYEEQRNRIYKQKQERKEESRRNIIAYLQNHPCIDCGNTNILVLDFDHRNDKKHNVCDMLAGGYVWNSIMNEIKKCDVRCANCHRIKTANQLGYFKRAVPEDGIGGVS